MAPAVRSRGLALAWCVRSDNASFAVQLSLHQSFTDVVCGLCVNQYVTEHQWAIY